MADTDHDFDHNAKGPFTFEVPDGFDDLELSDRARIILHHLIEAAKPDGIMPGLDTVIAEFTGSGDSADDCTWTFKTDALNFFFNARIDPRTDRSMDTFVWEFVERDYGGWENNEGGFGTVTFDITKRSCVLDMNYRVETSENQGETALFDDSEHQQEDLEFAKDQVVVTPEVVPTPEAKPEPVWLFHGHYGPDATPLTVYDNLDGTFTMLDGQSSTLVEASAEQTLRVFTSKINELVLSNISMKG